MPTRNINNNLTVFGDGAEMFLKSADHNVARIIPRGTGSNLDKGLLSLFDTGTEDVRIDTAGNSWFNGGNVGIGQGSPTAKLHLKGDGGSSGLTFKTTDASNNETFFIMDGGRAGVRYHPFSIGIPSTTSVAGNAVFQVEEAGLLTVLSTGKVGIGTTSPIAKFEVTDGSSSITLQEYTNGAAIFLDGVDGDFTGGDYFHILANSNSYLGLGGYGGGTTPLNISNAGKVGIGTTSPSFKLSVDGTVGIIGSRGTYIDASEDSTATSHIFTTNDDVGDFSQLAGNLVIQARVHSTVYRDIIFAGGLSTAGPLMTIQGGGKVGIGTTSPYSVLQVGDTEQVSPAELTIASRYHGGGPMINFRSGHPNNGNVWNMGRILCTDDGNYNGRLEFRTTASGGHTGTQPATRMVIKATGNVGIGTTSPAQKLHVNGNVDIDNGGILLQQGYGTNFGVSGYDIVMPTTTRLGIKTAGGERMSILNNGYVGIGVTTPSRQLVVANSMGLSGTHTYIFGGDNEILAGQDGSGYYYATGNGQNVNKPVFIGDNNSYIRFNSGDAERMRITSAGNVGINKSSPAQKLDIGAGHIRLDAGYSLQWDNSHERIEQSDGHLEFFVNNTEAMTLDTNGLGIGTTSPTDTLDVNGGIRLSTSGKIQGRSYPYTTNIGSGANATTTNITAGSTDKSEISLIGGDVGDRIEFKTNSTERMRITSAGEVLIGRTSNVTSQKLQVNGFIDITDVTNSALRWFDGSTFRGGLGLDDWATSNSAADLTLYGVNNLHFVSGGGNNRRMTIHSGGNVGIGTISPTKALDVRAEARVWNGSNGIELSYSTSNGSGIVASANTSGTLEFRTNIGAAAKMFITNAGNVGIGTTSPDAKLVSAGIVDGDFTALRLMNQKTYGSGTGTNEKVRFVMGISESGTAFSAREGFAIDVGVIDQSDSSNAIVNFGVRDGGTLGTYQTVNGHDKSVDFVGNVTVGNLFLANSSSRISNGANGEIGFNYNTGATGGLVWYGGGTTSKFSVTNAGNATFAGTVSGFGDFTGINTALNTRTGSGVAIGRYTSAYGYIDLASTNSTFGSWIDFSKGNGSDYAGRIRYHNSLEKFIFTVNGTNQLEIFKNSATFAGIVYLGSDRVFADNYHPNADTLTTARNIALTGDVTGNVNFNGSGNVSITTAVANDSHTHDGRYYTETESANHFKTLAVQGNFMNTYSWSGDTVGSTNSGWSALGSTAPFSGNSSYSQNGTDAENTRAIATLPNGAKGVVWRTPSNDSTSNADGGWNCTINGVDSTKAYRSVVYFRKTDDSNNGQFYHGCHGSHTLNINGSANTNPYFQSPAISTFVQDRWYVSIGYIQAYQSSGAVTGGQSGVYDCTTGKLVSGGQDFMMKNGSTTQIHRTYLYYSSDPSTSVEFYAPRFEELNGNEPSKQELVNKGLDGLDAMSFHSKYDPEALTQLTESSDANDDKFLLWDESASVWKYMRLDDLQDSIDNNTTFSAGTGLSLSGTTFSLTDTASKLSLAGGTMNGHLNLGDSIRVKLGQSQDLQLVHDGSNSYIHNVAVGHLYLRQTADNKNIILESDNGSGGSTAYLTINGSTERIENLKNVFHYDNVRAQFGDGADLQIYHDSSNSKISHTGSGGLYIGANLFGIQNGAHTETYIDATNNGAVNLYHNNSKRFETTSTGAAVIGGLSTTNTIFARKDNISDYTNAQIRLDSFGGSSSLAGLGFHISGQLGRMLFMNSSGDLFWNSTSSKIWHAGNDGSGSGLDADKLDGLELHTGRNNEANKVVRTDSNGYLNAGWINTTSGDIGSGIPDRVYTAADTYVRYADLASFRSLMNVTAKATYQGREQSTSDTNYWVGTMGWGSTDFNTLFNYGSGHIESWSNPTNAPNSTETSHWTGHQSMHYTNGTNHYGHQFVVGAGNPAYCYLRGRWGGSPTSWAKMWNSANDGSGSGLDADKLDAQEGSYYRNASNLNAGTISAARLSTANTPSLSDNNTNIATTEYVKGQGYVTTDTNTTYSAGTALTLSGTTFNHSDTSSQASVSNSTGSYIQSINLDGQGHVTAITSSSETTYSAGRGLDLSGTQFLLETDLRDSISYIGFDSNDYIHWSNNSYCRTVVAGTERFRVKTDGVDVNGVVYANALRTDAASTSYSLITRNTAASNYVLYVQSPNSGGTQKIATFRYGSASAGGGTEVMKIARGDCNIYNANLTVSGSITGSSKNFSIKHPTKEGKRLIHSCIEGPEVAVYFRGRSKSNTIEMPDYWGGLVDLDSMTVELTAIGPNQDLYVEDIADDGEVTVGSNTETSLNYFYVVYGERKDIDKLEIEIEDTGEVEGEVENSEESE